MGWTVPCYSSQHSDFDADCGVGGGVGLRRRPNRRRAPP
ncbi:hypothetical protein ACQPYK_26810 [Streptosporangium sp. CA-135522]